MTPADLAKTLLDKYKIWTNAIDSAGDRRAGRSRDAARVHPAEGAGRAGEGHRRDRARLKSQSFHTAHRDRPELLAVFVPAERLPAFAEVVEPGAVRTGLGGRPVESVRLDPLVFTALAGAPAAVHGVEPRAATGDERGVCRLAEVGRLLANVLRSGCPARAIPRPSASASRRRARGRPAAPTPRCTNRVHAGSSAPSCRSNRIARWSRSGSPWSTACRRACAWTAAKRTETAPRQRTRTRRSARRPRHEHESLS